MHKTSLQLYDLLLTVLLRLPSSALMEVWALYLRLELLIAILHTLSGP